MTLAYTIAKNFWNNAVWTNETKKEEFDHIPHSAFVFYYSPICTI